LLFQQMCPSMPYGRIPVPSEKERVTKLAITVPAGSPM
jgi:hypothetical protein